MNRLFKNFSTFLFLGFIILTGNSHAVTPQTERVGHVEVRLVAEDMTIQPGQPFVVGLHIIPDDEWHVYWINPGDAGLPPTLKWELPQGFTASEINFPAPDRIDVPPLTAYGYHGEVLYPVTITPPIDLGEGENISLTVKADWLVCRESCIPGTANLQITIPVSHSPPIQDESVAELFHKTIKRLPSELPQNFITQATLSEKHIFLDLLPDKKLENVSLEFFSSGKNIIKYSSEQILTQTGNSFRLELTRSPYSIESPDSLNGILRIVSTNDTLYYNLKSSFGQETQLPISLATTSSTVNSLLLALMFAFLGGLILNLMPCVLPVLSLKVLGLVNQASHNRRASILHGVFFTFGVLLSFWLIVGIMFALQAGGAQLGWGFQLQSPTFVMVLATFLFLFALSLFGLFEISFLTGTAGSLASKQSSGYSSSFVSGVTATLLATPCTAPFMGAALGYSLTQPALHSFLIYTLLGFGMASPYLVLAIFPQLLKFVPKPGAWMETLKQALGFLMSATVIWLGWVLATQAGSNALVILLLIFLFVAIAAWIYGRWGIVTASSKSKLLSRTIACIIILSSLVYGHEAIKTFSYKPSSLDSTSSGIQWQEFNQKYLQELQADNKPVFIDFTAAWCLSCQVNEQVAFSSQDVQDKFIELGIVPLKADWTNRSEEIAQTLAKFGRNSVPLYILYSGKPNEKPVLLPEIITPGIVLDALEKL